MLEITGRNEKKKKRDEYFVPVAEQRARQEQEQEPGRWALGRWARGHDGRQAGARGRRHSMGAQGRAERSGRAGGLAGRSAGRAGHDRLGGLGVLLGQRAMHLVHSACFGPV